MAVLIIIRGLLIKVDEFGAHENFFFFFSKFAPSSLLPARGPRLARLYIGFVHLPSSLFFVGNNIPKSFGNSLFTCCV